MFKALSNPNRLSIFLRLVSRCGSGAGCATDTEARACVGELGRDLGVVPSTVSHHIKELRRAGLIRMERRGQSIECCIEPDALKALRRFFEEASDNSPAGAATGELSDRGNEEVDSD